MYNGDMLCNDVLQRSSYSICNLLCILLLTLTSGNSSDTAGLSAEGITGRVLLILSTIIQLLVWTVMLAAVTHNILGLYVLASLCQTLLLAVGLP